MRFLRNEKEVLNNINVFYGLESTTIVIFTVKKMLIEIVTELFTDYLCGYIDEISMVNKTDNFILLDFSIIIDKKYHLVFNIETDGIDSDVNVYLQDKQDFIFNIKSKVSTKYSQPLVYDRTKDKLKTELCLAFKTFMKNKRKEFI